VQFIKNFRSNNFATFDARPLRIPIHWCGRLGLSTAAPFLTISMHDLLRSTTTTSNKTSSSSTCSLRDLLLLVVGSIRAGTGREAVEEGAVDCSAFRVWGLYPDEVTRASSTSVRRDLAYTQLPEHFAQSSRTQDSVPAMSHTKDSVWRLLTRLPADFDTALLPLFSTPQRTGGGGGGGSGCLGLMLESCLLPARAVGTAGRSGTGRVWPSDRILGNQQLVGEGKASAALFKIGDSVDVLDGSHCWVTGEVSLIDRVQSPDPARVFLVITVRVPATNSSSSSGQQVIQLMEGSTRVLRVGTITALLLSDEDRCSRYQHEYQPSQLGIASLLTDSYAASGLPFTCRDKQSAAAQTIDLYGLAAREVHLLSRALSRGPGNRKSCTGLKLLHLLVLTDGLLLLDNQCRGCAVITSKDERTGIYEATAWPRIVAQLHRLNNSVDPAVAFSSHLLGLRDEQRREEQRRITAAASRRDGDTSAVLSRVSGYIRCPPLLLTKKNRQHTSRVSAVTVDTTGERQQQQDSKSINNNYQGNNNSSSSSHSQQHQQRSGTATTAQLTLQQYGSYPGGPYGGVTSLVGVAGTYLSTYLSIYLPIYLPTYLPTYLITWR